MADKTTASTSSIKAMASWNGQKWEISTSKILSLQSVSSSIELDADNNEDKAGSAPTNTKKIKLQEFEFSFKAAGVAGTDARETYELWTTLIGQHAPFMLGTKRFGPKEVQLIKVSLTNGLLDNSGRIVVGTIDITLQEYDPKRRYAEAQSSGVSSGDKANLKNGTGGSYGDEYDSDDSKDNKKWTKPIKSYRVSSSPGYRAGSRTKSRDHIHYGYDLAAPKGTPVYACFSGTCTVTRSSSNYGLHITLSSGKYKCIYGHLSSVNVSSGSHVKKGQKIGGVGMTGNATGNHLHFEPKDTSKGSTRSSQFMWPKELAKKGINF